MNPETPDNTSQKSVKPEDSDFMNITRAYREHGEINLYDWIYRKLNQHNIKTLIELNGLNVPPSRYVGLLSKRKLANTAMEAIKAKVALEDKVAPVVNAIKEAAATEEQVA